MCLENADLRAAALGPAHRLRDGAAPVCARHRAALAPRACEASKAHGLRAGAHGGRILAQRAASGSADVESCAGPRSGSALGGRPAWRPSDEAR